MDTKECHNTERDIIRLIGRITRMEYELNQGIPSKGTDLDTITYLELSVLLPKVLKFNSTCLIDGDLPYTIEDRECRSCFDIFPKSELDDGLCPMCYDEIYRYKAAD